MRRILDLLFYLFLSFFPFSDKQLETQAVLNKLKFKILLLGKNPLCLYPDPFILYLTKSNIDVINKHIQKKNIYIDSKLTHILFAFQFPLMSQIGSGESGKSTVLKGLKIIHKIDMTDAELLEYVHSLRRNAVQCMNILIEQANIFEYEFDEVLKV